ncbi:hypothetical protein CA54_01370 [Symmachiella macrocystis]|uniref:DUF2007 domain-containing protein n=1 Tax=Symmachiella macrocystis TaxID=2527985 RepID=A0A5C6BIF7_9PLAN|nr:DUF2007 domain-containing protein [Symmachiella macrocystis]TWU11331.1 hypothetical protein CA54_01370 [Symmachiella macrocystis]
MALNDPVAVYNAAKNTEAQNVCFALEQSGIEAHIIEDVSPGGMWAFGTLPEIHKPQVFVEKTDVERAVPIIEEFEQTQCKRRGEGSDDAAVSETVEAECEGCGRRTEFPAAKIGTVETCPHCGEYLDVGGDDDDEFDWSEEEAATDE